jgi:hypothetical protein
MFVSNPLDPPEIRLPDDLTMILVGVCRAMTPLCKSDALILRAAVRIMQAVHALVFRFDRWREGLIRPARKHPQRQPPKAPAENQPPVKDPSRVMLPRRFGWLPQYLPETAIFAEQLQQFLADPEVADLFARCPQAGKILRPICRILGVQPIPEILRQKAPNHTPPPLPTAPLEARPQHPSTPTSPPAPFQQAPSRNGATPPPRVFKMET